MTCQRARARVFGGVQLRFTVLGVELQDSNENFAQTGFLHQNIKKVNVKWHDQVRIP